jgi:hypothetical protein
MTTPTKERKKEKKKKKHPTGMIESSSATDNIAIL